MKMLKYVLLIFLCWKQANVSTQTSGIKDISEVSRNDVSAKWIITPVFTPNFIINGKSIGYTYNSFNDVVLSDQRRLGLTLDKFYPNGNRGYGADLVYEKNSYFLDEGGEEMRLYQDDQLAIRPFLTFNNNALSKSKFGYLDLGLDTRLLVRNRRYDYNDARDIKSSPYLKRVTTYLLLRLGKKAIASNHFLISRVGQSRFELDLAIPVFELGNRIKSPRNNVYGDSLYKGNYSPSFLNIRYAESIDNKPRNIVGIEEIKLPANKITKFFLPPVNFNSPLTPLFGGLYVSTLLFSPVDTFGFSNSSDTIYIGRESDQNISIGMNIGFLGNYTPYYSTNRDFRHFLLSVGMRRENLFLRNRDIQYIKRTSLESGLSFQYGFKNTFFLSGGYLFVWRFKSEQNFTTDQLLFENKHYIRAGVGFMHGIGLTFDIPIDNWENKYQKSSPVIGARFGF